jgi:hypothetical protein
MHWQLVRHLRQRAIERNRLLMKTKESDTIVMIIMVLGLTLAVTVIFGR